MALVHKHMDRQPSKDYSRFLPGDIVLLENGSYYRYIPQGYLKPSVLAELKAPTGTNFICNIRSEWHSSINPVIDNNRNRISIDHVWRPKKPWKYINKDSMKITLSSLSDSYIIWPSEEAEY